MFRHVQESPLSPSVVPRACGSSVTENAQRFWTKSKSGTRKSCFSFDSANAIKLNNGFRLSVQRVTTVTNAGSCRPHYAGEIWKWCFHSENASNISVHTTPEKFENSTITTIFYLYSWDTRTWKSHDYPHVIVLHKNKVVGPTQRSWFLLLTADQKDRSLWDREWTVLGNLASCKVIEKFCVGGMVTKPKLASETTNGK